MTTHLTLFFTRGVSLRTWSMTGNLDREIAIYRRLIDHGRQVGFLTYGDASDLAYTDRLGGIRILANESGLPLEEYENRLMELHGDTLRTTTIIKTNQTYGGEKALAVAQSLKIPFIARCGYMWSFNAAKEHGEDSPIATEARRVEDTIFRAADRVVVTTEVMQAAVQQRLPETIDRVRVIPNYVDTEVFRPYDRAKEPGSLVFVGRIAPEKNLPALLEAVRPLRVKLTLIGEGKLRPELHREFSDLDDKVIWEGNVPNSLLPKYLNRAEIFILPSLYEGHPKALLEAMSCGMTVIGCDSPGIRQVIDHGKTGMLSGTDPVSLRSTIEDLLSQPELMLQLGRNAREYVIRNLSLDRIFRMESSLLNELDQS